MNFLSTLDSLNEKYSFRLALAACLLLPLKLSLAYFCLVPVLLLWIAGVRGRIWRGFSPGSAVLMPYVFFVLLAFVSLFFGFNVPRSLDKLAGVAFFGLTMLAMRDVCLAGSERPERILLALVIGQSIAAFYSILEGAFGPALPRILIGAVSESGQLGLTVPIACGLLVLGARSPLDNSGPGSVRRKVDCFIGAVSFCAFAAFAFSSATRPSAPIFYAELFVCALFLGIALTRLRRIWKIERYFSERCGTFLKTIALPLLVAALLANLKRGPWMGVLVGGLVFLWFENRKLVLPIILASAALLATVRPVQDRLLRSEEHFFIVGGRSEIWDIGAELAKRYPLGVGYRNSNVLQKFSESVPAELTHFHNNLLNILVETGWLGLAIFLWWIYSIVRAGFAATDSRRQRILRRSLGCAILSWQTAGLVEYNFGDSEVVLVALIAVGVLAALIADENENRERAATHH